MRYSGRCDHRGGCSLQETWYIMIYMYTDISGVINTRYGVLSDVVFVFYSWWCDFIFTVGDNGTRKVFTKKKT